ncbi:MAG TPA: alkaline phosphatase family protein [Leptolinea sp.]
MVGARMIRNIRNYLLCIILLCSCTQQPAAGQVSTLEPTIAITLTSTLLPSATATLIKPTSTFTPVPTPRIIPTFKNIVMILFENREFGFVIGNSQMPNYNRLAKENALLTQEFAIMHPSLPNYLALIGGDTFGITSGCENCFISAHTLVDDIEAAGMTWKTYQEDFPRPCFLGSTDKYAQNHNPFIYFDSIRLDKDRCNSHIVNLKELPNDLQSGSLPNFVFIMPNLCNSAHDCDLKTADTWLGPWIDQLQAYPGMNEDGLIILTWDEGQGEHGCCGIEPAGGRVATVFISDKVKPGVQDKTPYTHYSILKTISAAWGLPQIGKAALPENRLITGIWK